MPPAYTLSDIDRERAQSSDALLERRGAHAEVCGSPRHASFIDNEGSKLLGQGLMGRLQLFQRCNHVGPAGELRTSAIRAEFALPREPEHDHAGQDAEHDLGHDHRYEVRRTATVFRPEEGAINEVA